MWLKTILVEEAWILSEPFRFWRDVKELTRLCWQSSEKLASAYLIVRLPKSLLMLNIEVATYAAYSCPY
jgi:hypothetical protein